MALTITNTLTPYKKGYDRDFLRREEVLGEIIAELQDHVESIDAAFDDSIDIASNSADIQTLQDEVETPTTGLLDRTTALETLPEGNIKVGSESDVSSNLDATGSGKILVGDGDTLASVSVSGDATLASSGALTVANSAITTAKINNAAVTGAKASTVMATKSLFIPLATVATTGAQEFTVPVPHAGTLIAAELCAKDALAADDTNYVTFALTNKGQAGAGTTAMLSATASGTTKATGGAAIAAYTTRNLPLHATGGNAAVVANDCLAFSLTASGTLANTVTEGRVRLDFLVTT